MCEYEGDYQEISERTVTTRKEHECTNCMRDWPKGSRMRVAVGLFEGDIQRTYECPVCVFSRAQVDHAPLHFCWGHFWHDVETGDVEVYDYIKECLAAGTTPTEVRADEIRAAALVAERAE